MDTRNTVVAVHYHTPNKDIMHVMLSKSNCRSFKWNLLIFLGR